MFFKNEALLIDSFQNLTPFKQREYAEYIDRAKRTEIKQSHLGKIIPMILKGLC